MQNEASLASHIGPTLSKVKKKNIGPNFQV